MLYEANTQKQSRAQVLSQVKSWLGRFLVPELGRKVMLPTCLPPINSLRVAAGGHTPYQPTTQE